MGTTKMDHRVIDRYGAEVFFHVTHLHNINQVDSILLRRNIIWFEENMVDLSMKEFLVLH